MISTSIFTTLKRHTCIFSTLFSSLINSLCKPDFSFEHLCPLLTKLHIIDFSHLAVFNTRHASVTARLTHLFCNTAEGTWLRCSLLQLDKQELFIRSDPLYLLKLYCHAGEWPPYGALQPCPRQVLPLHVYLPLHPCGCLLHSVIISKCEINWEKMALRVWLLLSVHLV